MVAVLFARRDSIYKTFTGLDVYDMDRDARTFKGGAPVVAHPPCRAWGRLRGLAKPRHDEKDLARFAVDVIRRNGGVLEHPATSTLWADKGLPKPRCCDEFGGFTLDVEQLWWGHQAVKKTWLYIVGADMRQVQASIPFRMDYPTHVVATSARSRISGMKELSKAKREHTPPAFAEWLVWVASLAIDRGAN